MRNWLYTSNEAFALRMQAESAAQAEQCPRQWLGLYVLAPCSTQRLFAARWVAGDEARGNVHPSRVLADVDANQWI